MAVGIQQTWAGINNQAGQLAVNIRNDFQALLNLYEANSNALWGGQ
jgi:hypothetical protein